MLNLAGRTLLEFLLHDDELLLCKAIYATAGYRKTITSPVCCIDPSLYQTMPPHAYMRTDRHPLPPADLPVREGSTWYPFIRKGLISGEEEENKRVLFTYWKGWVIFPKIMLLTSKVTCYGQALILRQIDDQILLIFVGFSRLLSFF